MEAADHLYDCTRRLYIHLKQGLPKKEREAFLGAIQELLDERQGWINSLPPTFRAPEASYAKELLAYDREIQEMLKVMFETIRTDIHQFKKKRTTNKRYANLYQNGNVDGMFLDKRK